MAGGAGLADDRQQRIAVAVGGKRDQFLHIAGGLALLPEGVFAARKIGHPSAGESAVKGVAVHPRLHQHPSAAGALGCDRQKSAAVKTQGGDRPPQIAARAGGGGFQVGEKIFGRVHRPPVL